ncbi:MAG: magnesium/cobalt transporter CorA [Sedimentisphaerales bacterium]|nr:magnesium/cobalt transporter CorA [Sedimentisphaerales bacterium]
MARQMKKQVRKLGLPPGALVHTGQRKVEHVHIESIRYTDSVCDALRPPSLTPDLLADPAAGVAWLNIDGLHDVGVIETIGQRFDLHPLVLEDILHTDQRAKVELDDRYIYAVLQMLRPENDYIQSEQISLILTDRWVLTFQEAPGDVFDPIRDRIRQNKGRIRKLGPDYLFYTLLDALVDSYFLTLEKIGDRIEALQEEVARNPDPDFLNLIHHLKRETLFIRRAIWPVRELVNNLLREDDSPLITPATRTFLKDVYDHIVQIVDIVETYREMTAGLLDIYLTGISNRMNAVMKVLTIIATIFIPLTFIAGVYGMNFQHMPELSWRWGYPAVWIVMGVAAIIMLILFKRKRWL